METSGSYSAAVHDLMTKFDSTDKILDEIDAKLNGVNSASQMKHMDVNEDPGVDIASLRMFRHHMEGQDSKCQSSQAQEFNSIDCKPCGSSNKPRSGETFHEKRTNLLQLYDDDINLLRRMLRENTDVAKPQTSVEAKPLQNGFSDCVVDDFRPHNRDSREAEFVTRNDDKPSLSPIGNFSPMEEAYLCKCGLGDELEKITKDRDELLARIRRGEASKTSIEERQELERQLHSTKSALFQQRKKSRQQLEDIEEKLEEAQHYYDEKLAEKDDVIAALNEKVEALQRRDSSERHSPSPTSSSPAPDIGWMQEEMAKRDEEIGELTDLVSKQNEALNELKSRLDVESQQSTLQMNEKLTLERKKWEEKVQELKRSLEKAKFKYESELEQIESEKDKACENVVELKKKIDRYHKELEEKDAIVKNESLQKENDYKATTELLRSKIESLKDELSLVFASKSEMELDHRRKVTELARESKAKETSLKEENKKLEDELQHVRVEIAQAAGKLKDFKIDIEHQDQSLASSISDECQKLSNLLQSIQNSTNISRKTYIPKGVLVSKRAVCELQDVVDSLSRAANDLLCELARLKRDSIKRIAYTSLHSSSDVTIATEEAKQLKEKLSEKESELSDLQANMNHWKDLTAQRLAEKFQEELQLQVERKLSQHRSDHMYQQNDTKPDMGRFSKSTNSLENGSNSHGDTSTMKLLCHLQGRVKQLRSENDLLRSSNYIKTLDGR